MELPKNVTQIGETDRTCKIYVEDYVMSYMKQMNRFAEDKEIAIALYGRKSEEQSLNYCFIYGACKIDFLQKIVRHLSQAQNQEIERLRKKYFGGCDFLGYVILNGEMIEGIHIVDRNGCRFVKGYACFYEKNDPMLAYMLDNRVEEATPEAVSLEKYEEVKKRQEERRQEYTYGSGRERRGVREVECAVREKSREQSDVSQEDGKNTECEVVNQETPEGVIQASNDKERISRERSSQGRSVTEIERHMRGMRFAAASMFVLLCLVSIVTLQTDGLGQEVGDRIRQLFQGEETSQMQEDTVQVMSNDIQTLVAEEQLAEAIRLENEQEAADIDAKISEQTPAPVPTEMPTPIPTPVPTIAPTPVPTPEPTPIPTPEPTPAPVQSEKVYNTYRIRSGDTLIGISLSLYGSESYVKEICELNHISDPDNIQIGQKILLP